MQKRLKCLAFSASVFSNVKKQFGGYYGTGHRFKNKSEKVWKRNPGTTSTGLEKQLLETFAHHCRSNFSGKPTLSLECSFVVFPLIVFDFLLL